MQRQKNNPPEQVTKTVETKALYRNQQILDSNEALIAARRIVKLFSELQSI